MPELSFCTVCASNNNRSMEAHRVLEKAGFHVRSYGTGSAVRLPGISIDKPNVFPFTTPYKEILKVIESQMKESNDPKLHRSSGVLDMTLRNKSIKDCPERWPYYNQPSQRMEIPGFRDELDFDIVICCEERCFDLVVEDFLNRNYWDNENVFRKCHVFNVDIRDDHENAKIGGKAILELANGLENLVEQSKIDNGSWEDSLPLFMSQWQLKFPNLPILYSLCYH